MAYLLGTLVGGSLICILVGLVIGLVFKKKAPNERALISALGAWIVSGLLAGFGMADDGPFRFSAIVYYIPGALIAFAYLRWHYCKTWREDSEGQDELEATFE